MGVDTASWLIGFIWVLFCGLAIGNYATNPIYRLPRNEPLFGRTPYCGDCNAELKPKDLFPILSWLSTMGKCRYCGSAVPGAYTVAEALIALVFVLLYAQFQFGDEFILIGFGATALIMLVMMEVIDRFFSDKTWVFFLVMGAGLRILQDHTITTLTQGAFYMALPAMAWWCWKRRGIKERGETPNYVKLWLAAGVWLQPVAIVLFLAVWGVLEWMVKLLAKAYPKLRGNFPLSASFAVALLVPLLMPESSKFFFGWIHHVLS